MTKSIISIILIFTAFTSIICSNIRTIKDFPTFDVYIQNFNKNYDSTEYEIRQKIYNQRIQFIITMDCQACGVNNLTDWTNIEKKKFTGNIPIKTAKSLIPSKSASDKVKISTPLTSSIKSFSWLDKNKITTPKQQAQCGSCWAFTTIAFIQADLIINQNYNTSLDLSEQYVTTCEKYSYGCDGGYLGLAIQMVVNNGGVPREQQYSYSPYQAQFQYMCSTRDLVKIAQNQRMIEYYNISDTSFIESLVLLKPVAVTVCAQSLLAYAPTTKSRTIFCLPYQTDHTVIIVGFTPTQWIVKNSWGVGWGINGYAYISKKQWNDCCIGRQVYTTGQITYNCTIQYCKTCVGQNACADCLDGYYVANVQSVHLCVPCPIANCLKCPAINYCSQCSDGYVLQYWDYTCKTNNITGCILLLFSICLECQNGFTLSTDGKCDLPCTSNCNKCDLDYCFQCDNQSTLKRLTFWTSVCIICKIQNCNSCSDINICEECMYSYTLQNNTCFQQQCTELNCVNCNNTNNTICLQCLPSFILQNTVCVPQCDLWNCLKCETKTTCFQCDYPYHVDSYGRCQIKYNCSILHCQLCGPNNTCNFCNWGYAGDNCQINACLNGSRFTGFYCQCPDGYLMTYFSKQCLKCQDNCFYCQNRTTCSTCLQFYYLQTNGTCSKCLQNCISCKSNNLCIQCLPNFRLQQSSLTCIPLYGLKIVNQSFAISCSSYCLECQSEKNCIHCAMGYSINQGYCEKCPQNCVYCYYQNNQKVCSDCPNRFLLINNTCQLCAVENCLECWFDINRCQKCTVGYFINNEICVKGNIQNCQIFNLNKCTKCSQGYTLLTSGECFQCMFGCSECDRKNLNSCLICLQGTYMNANLCKSCSQGCKTCSSQLNCTSCLDKHYLANGNKCLARCDDMNCYKCSDNLTNCLICFNGYNLNIEKKCQFNNSCNITNSCQFCPSSYYLTSLSTCLMCPTTHCASCLFQSSFICISCQESYFLNNSDCSSCKQPCLQCQSANYCLKCDDGYFLYQGKCQLCDQNCKTCQQNSQQCKTCFQQFEINQRQFCIRKDKVFANISINMDYSQYNQNIVNIFNDLVTLFKLSNKKYLQISKVYSGSTIMETYVIPQNSNMTLSLLDTVTKQLQVGPSIGGFQIIKASISTNYIVNPQKQNSESGQQISESGQQSSESGLQTKYIIIICVFSIVIGTTLLVLIVCLIRKKYLNRQQQVNGQKQQSQNISNKYINDNIPTSEFIYTSQRPLQTKNTNYGQAVSSGNNLKMDGNQVKHLGLYKI